MEGRTLTIFFRSQEWDKNVGCWHLRFPPQQCAHAAGEGGKLPMSGLDELKWRCQLILLRMHCILTWSRSPELPSDHGFSISQPLQGKKAALPEMTPLSWSSHVQWLVDINYKSPGTLSSISSPPHSCLVGLCWDYTIASISIMDA